MDGKSRLKIVRQLRERQRLVSQGSNADFVLEALAKYFEDVRDNAKRRAWINACLATNKWTPEQNKIFREVLNTLPE